MLKECWASLIMNQSCANVRVYFTVFQVFEAFIRCIESIKFIDRYTCKCHSKEFSIPKNIEVSRNVGTKLVNNYGLITILFHGALLNQNFLSATFG